MDANNVSHNQFSPWQNMVSGVSKRTVLGPILFFIWINIVFDTIKHTFYAEKLQNYTLLPWLVKSEPDKT